jgi:hypothetical protein
MLLPVHSQSHTGVPIRPATVGSDSQAQIAELAFQYWLTRHFGTNGSPESYLQAVITVIHRNVTRPIGGVVAIDRGIRRARKAAAPPQEVASMPDLRADCPPKGRRMSGKVTCLTCDLKKCVGQCKFQAGESPKSPRANG